MANFGVTEFRVVVGENTQAAANSATDAAADRALAQTARAGAETARDVAVASSVQYPSAAAAVAALADGAFGSYLDASGNPVWGQRTGSTMTPLPGPWIDADKIGASDNRDVQAWIDDLSVGSVGLRPSGDVSGNTDLAAMQALVAAGKTIRLENYDGTNAYYVSGDVTALIPENAPGMQYAASILGDPGARENLKPRIIVTKPGVTPFPASWGGALVGLAIVYGQMDVTPAVSGQTVPYARAIAATGTISTVEGKLRLTVPAGGLIGPDAAHPNVTRGSMVVMLADPAKEQDYWIHNYGDEDSIFQIDKVVSDTVCTLQGKDGTAYTGPVHIRGNAAATVWTEWQPTGFIMRDCALGAVPGCAFMTMGAQFLSIKNNIGTIDGNAPHLRMIYAGNGQGLNRDAGVGTGGGWGNGGVYHQCAIREVRTFFAGGGFAISGLIDSDVRNLQVDPNAGSNAATATYFTPPTAIQRFGGLVNVDLCNITCEDSPADGIELFQCSRTRLINPHVFELGVDSWPITIRACSNCAIEGERIDIPTGGDPNRRIRYLGQSSAANNEVALDRSGRFGRKTAVRQQGLFGREISVLDQRDRMRFALSLPAATLEASSASIYFLELPSAEFDEFDGFDHFRLEDISFEHGGAWTGAFNATPPDIACGTAADHAAVFAELPLNVAAGFYRRQSRLTGFSPVDFCAGQLGANTNLRFTIRSGDGGPFNNGTFNAAGDLKIWVTISGSRA